MASPQLQVIPTSICPLNCQCYVQILLIVSIGLHQHSNTLMVSIGHHQQSNTQLHNTTSEHWRDSTVHLCGIQISSFAICVSGDLTGIAVCPTIRCHHYNTLLNTCRVRAGRSSSELSAVFWPCTKLTTLTMWPTGQSHFPSLSTTKLEVVLPCHLPPNQFNCSLYKLPVIQFNTVFLQSSLVNHSTMYHGLCCHVCVRVTAATGTSHWNGTQTIKENSAMNSDNITVLE